MIGHESKLRLQAYLDGELSPADGRQVEAQLAADVELRQLAGELKAVGTLLATCAPEYRVPDSREFYWSKIARAIETAERGRETARRSSGLS